MSIIFQCNLSTDLWLSGSFVSESISQTKIGHSYQRWNTTMSKATSEINLVPNPHPCTQCKEPGSNRCPRFSKHWTCLETNCGLPVSKAWSNAPSPADTSPESPLHTPTWRNALHPPWENHPWDGTETPASHPARSTRPPPRPDSDTLTHIGLHINNPVASTLLPGLLSKTR